MMSRTLILSLVIIAALAGKVLGQGNTVDLQQQIDNAYKSGKKQVVIQPGTYNLTCPEAQTWHLQFRHMKDFTIDATNVTMIFSSRDKRGIIFEDCHNVTFRGASTLRLIPPFSQGDVKVIAADRKSIDVQVHSGYPTDIENPRFFFKTPVLTVFTTDGKMKKNVPDLYIQKIERRGDDLFRFQLREPVNAEIPLAVGDAAAWRGSSPGKPAGHEIDLRECSGMVLTGITIRNSFGIAIYEACGDGGNYYNYTYTYGPKPVGATRNPLLSGAADGFNSGAVRKGPTLENCLIEGCHDDGVNIHGQFAMATEAKGKDVVADYRGTLVVDNRRNPFAIPGDTIQFFDGLGRLAVEAKLVAIESLSGYREPAGKQTIDSRMFADRSQANYIRLTLDRDIPAMYGWYIANRDAIGDGFTIRNCITRDHRGHGFLIRAGNGIIENCQVDNIHMGGIVIAPELGSWNESSYVQNLIIRNNIIRQVGIATQSWNSGLTIAGFENGKFVKLPGGHRNIVIDGNRFENNDGINLLINAVIGVTVKNNQFVNPMQAPAFHGWEAGNNHRALIWIHQASEVKLQNNNVINPGSCMDKVIDATPGSGVTVLE